MNATLDVDLTGRRVSHYAIVAPIAAGAMGQVYAGIPCVVGGALSNVALKYLAPAQ